MTTDKNEPQTARAECSALLDWEYQPNGIVKRWRGFLRGYPDTTLVVLNLCEDRDDRCHMMGAVMPDGEEKIHTRVLVDWAKTASGWYLHDFIARLDPAHLSALRLLAQSWRMQNGDYPESKVDCADELLALIEPRQNR